MTKLTLKAKKALAAAAEKKRLQEASDIVATQERIEAEQSALAQRITAMQTVPGEALTPKELATINLGTALEIADRICEIRHEIEQAKAEQEALEADLKRFVTATGETDCGSLQAIRRANPAKLVGEDLTAKEMDHIKKTLLKLLGEDFGKTTLDISMVFSASKHDKAVQKALAQCKVVVLQETDWVFKKVA